VTAAQPTIVATSVQFARTAGSIWDGEVGPVYRHAIELARAGPHPRLCLIPTGLGDNPIYTTAFYSAFCRLELLVSHLALFPCPSIGDIREHLLSQDVIWVAGGSTANLLALWRLHGIDTILRECWEAGVVLMGTSAGSVCWHSGGTTDSFRLPLQPLTDGLRFLPYANSPHYSSESQRRPLTNQLVADGVIPDTFATDDGAGLVYHGTDLHEAISEQPAAKCYSITKISDGKAMEAELPTRLL
jgi:peptidase E